jgi:Icc-related predicted phosphoesterase
MKKKILITGDLHNEFKRLNALINRQRPEIIICCGDFGYWPRWEKSEPLSSIKPQGATIYWVDGNHEDHWSLRDRTTDELAPNIIYKPRGSTLKLEDGRNILFMGGAHSIDKEMRRYGWSWFPEETIHYRDLAHLPDEKVDIFITHTCPSELVLGLVQFYPEKTEEPSNIALSQLYEKYKPELWMFGHWHHYKEGRLGKTKWYALSHPYAGDRWWMWLPERREYLL